MLADLLPLMNDTVRQWHSPARDIHGRVKVASPGAVTEHRARVTYSPGEVAARGSREDMADAKATVWLIDHPHPISVGNTFELAGGVTFKVARLERRTLPDGMLTKVYLT